MRAKTQEEFDQANALDWKLEGIAAKLHIMAAAFQDGGDTLANELVETALMSVAEEVEAVRAAFNDLWTVGKQDA